MRTSRAAKTEIPANEGLPAILCRDSKAKQGSGFDRKLNLTCSAIPVLVIVTGTLGD
jgi:hypothetical protein